jgi:hypothetical protein
MGVLPVYFAVAAEAEPVMTKQSLLLESTGGKAINITLDDDGELVVCVDDPTADDYTDFILSASDLLRVRDWLNRVLPAPEPSVTRQKYQTTPGTIDGPCIHCGKPFAGHHVQDAETYLYMCLAPNRPAGTK